jgi:hypothetical protein
MKEAISQWPEIGTLRTNLKSPFRTVIRPIGSARWLSVTYLPVLALNTAFIVFAQTHVEAIVDIDHAIAELVDQIREIEVRAAIELAIEAIDEIMAREAS